MPELLEFRYSSARSGHTIYAQELRPDAPPRAVIQIVHGVAEHMGRYEEVSRFLTAHGFLVCGEDHLGHGKTVEDGSYGFFAPKGGWDLVVRDVRRLRELEDAMIFLERKLSNGKTRLGLIGKLDLEQYSYEKGSGNPIRATEGTVLSRIPPG